MSKLGAREGRLFCVDTTKANRCASREFRSTSKDDTLNLEVRRDHVTVHQVLLVVCARRLEKKHLTDQFFLVSP